MTDRTCDLCPTCNGCRRGHAHCRFCACEPSAEADAAHTLGACICDGCREGFALPRPTPDPSAEADVALDPDDFPSVYGPPIGHMECGNCGYADVPVYGFRPATPPLDVEVLARALPDWMVEHPMGTTEDELRRTIADIIAREYAALAIPTPEPEG